jgi:hypothetical protein
MKNKRRDWHSAIRCQCDAILAHPIIDDIHVRVNAIRLQKLAMVIHLDSASFFQQHGLVSVANY